MGLKQELRLNPGASSAALPERPMDDLALMRGIAGGDAGALKALYDRHSSAVFTLALRMLKRHPEAEQLLTDVFFEVWNARDRYDETRANPLTYLMRLTRSRAIDRMRRKGAIGAGGAGSLGGVSLDPAAGIDVAVEDVPAAEADEEKERVRGALARLDPEQRSVIECAYFEGLSHSEVAAKLNKPLGSVKSGIRIGLAKLRDALRISTARGGEEPS